MRGTSKVILIINILLINTKYFILFYGINNINNKTSKILYIFLTYKRYQNQNYLKHLYFLNPKYYLKS